MLSEQSHGDMNRLFELSLDMLCIASVDGRFLRLNPAWEQCLGFGVRELEGRSFVDLVHPDDVAATHRALDQLANGKDVVDFVNRYRAKDGSYRWIEWRSTPHQQKLIYAAARDITERRRAEEALHRSEARFRSIVESSPTPMHLYYMDPVGRLILTASNPAADRKLGIEHRSLLGKPIEEAFPSLVGTGIPEMYRQVALGELSAQSFETPYRDERINGCFDVHVFRTGPDTIAVDFFDITERMRAAEAVREARDKLESILRAVPTGIGVVVKRVFKEVNDRICEMTGYSRGELLDQSSRMLYPDDAEFERVGREKYAQIQTSGAGAVETRWRRKDGRIIDVLLSSSPIESEDWSAGVTFTAMDITERKLAERHREHLEERLRQSQKMEAVGLLAGGVAHDFNNLLTPIIGYAEILASSLPPGGTQRADAEQIMRAAERARDLSRQLLAFGRKQCLDLRPLDLRTVLRNSEKLLRRAIREDVRIEYDLPDCLGAVRADAGQIELVLMNLAVNAQDAMPGGGVLRIAVADVEASESIPGSVASVAPGQCVQLNVSDTGCGIDHAVLPHIFEPFFTTKDRGKGTGLGLATVYGIIEQHGGRIDVSTKPGRGTCFTIHFPRHCEPAERQAISAAPAGDHRGKGQTILLMEDDEMVRQLVSTMLKGRGFNVLVADSTEECMRIAGDATNHVDLLLTDVIMPGMNGHQLYQRLRTWRPELRVLFMSGYAADILATHGGVDEDVALIQKPFTASALTERIFGVLAGASPSATMSPQ